MALYKVTWFLKYGRGGFSFSHFNENAVGYAGTQTLALRIARRYLVLCGGGVVLHDIRVSDDTIKGDSLVTSTDLNSINAQVSTMGGIQIKTAVTDTPDAQWTAFLLRLGNSPSVYGHQFMRGIPDQMEVLPGGITPDANWDTALEDYIDSLVTDGWGMKGIVRTATSRKKILSIAIALGTATITTDVAHGLIPGQKIRIGGFSGGANAVVNGAWLVQGVTNGTTFTVDALAPSTFFVAGPITSWGSVWSLEKVFAPYVKLFCTLIRDTVRKAGRPSDVLVGRRKIRR